MPCRVHMGHIGSPQYFFLRVDGEETFFVSFKPPRQGNEPGNESGIGVKSSGANDFDTSFVTLFNAILTKS